MEGMDRMSKDDYMTIHGDMTDSSYWKIEPCNPLDALRKLQKEGVFGELYPYFASKPELEQLQIQQPNSCDEIGKKIS